MKKKNYVCVLTVMILLLAACGTPSVGPGMTEPQGPRADLPLAEVYTVLSDDYCRSLADLGIDVPKDVIREGSAPESFERPVGEKKTYRTENRGLDLSYVSTYTYGFEGGAVDYYHIEGTEDGKIGFLKDGRISKLNGDPNIRVGLGDDASPEKVQEILAEEISDLVDFSQYGQVICDQTPTGRYEFVFMDMHDGHLIDFARVWVGTDGAVELISVIYGPEDGTQILDEVDQELVEELICAKVEELLNTKNTELREYHISDETTDGTMFGRFLTTYEGEVCLRYTVVSQVYVASEDRECHVSMHVVIPVRLVTGE